VSHRNKGQKRAGGLNGIGTLEGGETPVPAVRIPGKKVFSNAESAGWRFQGMISQKNHRQGLINSGVGKGKTKIKTRKGERRD